MLQVSLPVLLAYPSLEMVLLPAGTLGRSWTVFSTRTAFQVTTNQINVGPCEHILGQENCTWLRYNFCFQDLEIGYQVCFSPNRFCMESSYSTLYLQSNEKLLIFFFIGKRRWKNGPAYQCLSFSPGCWLLAVFHVRKNRSSSAQWGKHIYSQIRGLAKLGKN